METNKLLEIEDGDLRTCPFCGKSPEIKSRNSVNAKTNMIYIIVCYCGGYSATAHIMSDTIEEAILRWNSRH